jgi:hypothetical protein
MEPVRFREVQDEADLGRAHLAFLVVPAVLSVYVWTQLPLPWALAAIAVLWAAAVYLGLRVVGLLPGHATELCIDASGIELDNVECRTHLRWQDIARLSVMRLPSKKTPRWYLVAWLQPGVTVPVDPKGNLPAFDETIGALRLCDIRTFDYTEAEITSVLKEYAGDTWKPAPTKS